MSGSLAGYNPLEELDHTPPPQHQDLQHGSGGYKSKLTAMSAAVGGAACRYRECLKNHAASVGGNVTDGCGEFMPSGEEGTLEALKCAACNCHRNFHRKERGGGDGVMIVHPLQLPPPPALPPSMMTSPSSMNHHHHNQNHHHHHRSTQWGAAPPSSLPAPPPVKMAAYGSTATDSSSEEMNFNVYQSQTPYAVAKKRFRTKFSSGQKEKMMDFAEKLGWRIPREDDSQLQSFCAEVGVKRQVFKVWMHNNKNSATKKNSSGSDHHHQDDEDHHHQTPVGIAGM